MQVFLKTMSRWFQSKQKRILIIFIWHTHENICVVWNFSIIISNLKWITTNTWSKYRLFSKVWVLVKTLWMFHANSSLQTNLFPQVLRDMNKHSLTQIKITLPCLLLKSLLKTKFYSCSSVINTVLFHSEEKCILTRLLWWFSLLTLLRTLTECSP